MSGGPDIRVTLNGEPLRVPAGTRLLELLQSLDEPHAAGLVERNRRLVRRDRLAGVVLADGDLIEVILPAFGG